MEGYIQTLSEGKIKRYVQMLDINEDPELIAQYKKWHSEEYSWPEIRQGIREVGILEMELYIRGNHLVMIVDASADFDWQTAWPPCPVRLSGKPLLRSFKVAVLKHAATRNGSRWKGCSDFISEE